MAWLEVDDYPKMVAASDLGVCLHYSSSGLDLPMKVVDMFSAGLPCLAKDFEAVGELVRDRFNGRLFRDSKELAQQLSDHLEGFDAVETTQTLREMKQNLSEFQNDSWVAQWHTELKEKVFDTWYPNITKKLN